MTEHLLEDAAKILIVDDDRTMRLLLRHALERDGYDVNEAGNGVEALSLFGQERPDIILMDAAMPELDGFEACARLQKLGGGADTPVLMITGLDDDESVERAFYSGATDYITKPVNWAVLRQRVRRMVKERRAERHVNYLAYHDSLTGLPNRTKLIERLERAISRARRTDMKMGVLFLDLDGFKLVNDSLGHDIGDLLLRAVADRLAGCLRDTDTVARLGGDEFTVILGEVHSDEQIGRAARRVLEQLAKPIEVGGREIFVGASIGIAVFPSDGKDVRTLLRSADMAMYRAKDSGRNNYQFYTPDMADRALTRMSLESSIRRALEHEDFIVYYQPLIDTSSGTLCAFEALVRWEHAELGVVSPGEFIPLAEDAGLIGRLGELVIRQVCAQIKEWEGEGLDNVKIAINLSGRQFNDPELVNTIKSILTQYGVRPDALVLELTENTVMQNAEASIEMLDELKALGIALAVDDFGTGYSSLSYLKRLPIDHLKIDRSFVSNVPDDADESAIVRAIVALAHSLRLGVVAEGVEEPAQIEFLQELGCDVLQGFYFSKPKPAQEAVEFLRDRHRCLLPEAQASVVNLSAKAS
ncbi:MAG: EAL domain-containing protein [Gammaproteobacteria bacterium]|nr:EAL domain-containing protein [Gammaproteobacteria bacterium]